jgi:hypothetical protein
VLVLLVALKCLGEPVRLADLFWHLAMGRTIATTWNIPTVDVFSFTRAGTPYFDQPWLAQSILYAVHRAGLEALLAFNFACMVCASWLSASTARLRGATFTAGALAVVLLAPVAMRGWAVRPQALAVPVFAAFVYVLTRFRVTRRWHVSLASLPVLAALWANLHGSFLLAPVLVLTTLGAIVVDDVKVNAVDARRLLLLGGLCAAAPIANPHGVAIYGYVASLLRSTSVHELAPEWRPIALDTAEGLYVTAALLAAFALLARRRAWGDLVLVMPFALLEISAVRNGIWLCLVLAPIAATSLTAARSAANERLAWRISAVVAVLLAVVPWAKPRVLSGPYGRLLWRAPIGATLALLRDAHPPRRLLHDAATGSYLIWALPSQPVFLDTRLELYPVEQWRDMRRLSAGEDVPRLLDVYAIDGLLLDKQLSGPLVDLERKDARFVLRYEDDAHVYFAAR